MSGNDSFNEKKREIDLVLFLRFIWRKKGFILLSTIIVTGISIAISFLLPRVYRSSAFVNSYWPSKDVKGASIDIGYKIKLVESENTLTQVLDLDLFEKFAQNNIGKYDFVKRTGLTSDECKNFNKSIAPVHAFDVTGRKAEKKGNFVLGFNVAGEGKNPGKARAQTMLLKEFIASVIVNNEIIEYIKTNLKWETANISRNKNAILHLRYNLNELKGKENEVKKISKDFPSLNDVKQVVIADLKGSRRYLSPLQHLAGIKLEIIEIQGKIERTRRSNSISEYRLDLLKRFNELLQGKQDLSTDAYLMDNIREVFVDFFKQADQRDEVSEIVKNEVEEQLVYFDQLDTYVIRFASDPELPKFPAFPRKIIFAAVPLVFGLIFFTFLAFLIEALRNDPA